MLVNNMTISLYKGHVNFLRRGSSTGNAMQMAAQSACTTKQQGLPVVQQNQDPFCYLNKLLRVMGCLCSLTWPTGF